MKANADELTPRLLASELGRLACSFTAARASLEEDEPSLTTVTVASTLSSVLVALTSELETPRSAATAAVLMLGAASEASVDALYD